MLSAYVHVIEADQAARAAQMSLLDGRVERLRGSGDLCGFLSEPIEEFEGCVVVNVAHDLRLGLSLQHELMRRMSAMEAVVSLAKGDVAKAVQLTACGIRYVVESPPDRDVFLRTVFSALESSRKRHKRMLELQGFCRGLGSLTADELVVVEEMVAGNSLQTTAVRLQISLRTVERRRRSVLARLGVRSIGRLGVLIARRDDLADRLDRSAQRLVTTP